MAVTSGFFNSVNHDRLYNSEQISSMFDGIILDGIYQGLGDAFIVKPYSDLNCTVTVGTGRAWFDHTWTLNSTELALTLDDPNVLYDRIDAIVIDVDRRQDVRANSIKVVKGTVSETGATKPALIKEELHNQYPLAYVTVKAGNPAPISASNIETVIGQAPTTLVSAVLDHMDITMFVQQMEAEFDEWFEELKNSIDENTIASINNKLNELENFNEKISDSIINPDAYLASKETTISVTDLGIGTGSSVASRRGVCSSAVILPDGFVLKIEGVSTSGSICVGNVKSTIYNIDNVSIGSYETSSSNVGQFRINPGNQFSTFAILNTNSSYPYNIDVSIDKVEYYQGYSTVMIPSVLHIHITSDHVVSYSISSGSSLDGHYFGRNLQCGGVYTVAHLQNGGYISAVGEVVDLATPTNIIAFYKISSDGLVAQVGSIKRLNSSWTDSSNEMYGVLYASTSSSTEVGFGQFGSDAASFNGSVVGKVNVSTLDLTITGQDENGLEAGSFPFSNDTLIVKNNYKFIDSSGSSARSVYDSFTNSTELFKIPPYLDIKYSLKESASIGDFTTGLVSEDETVLISGHGGNIRAGLMGDGTGFMATSSTYSSSVLNSSSVVDALKLVRTGAAWSSVDGKKHKFLVPPPSSSNSMVPAIPIMAEQNNRSTYNNYIINVEIGG